MFKPKGVDRAIRIDLTGPEGTSEALVKYAVCFGKALGLDVDKITTEMNESDYDHLVETFDKYFGEYVILEW